MCTIPDERNDVSEQRSSLCRVFRAQSSAVQPQPGLPALAVTSAGGAGCPSGARFPPQQYLVKEARMFGFFRAASGVSSPSRSFKSALRGLGFKAS